MEDNPWRAPRLSGDAMHIMALLLDRGGGMRIEPLLRLSRLPPERLAAAVNELMERLWVDVAWRSDRARRAGSLPGNTCNARRIVTTHTGRYCYPYAPRF